MKVSRATIAKKAGVTPTTVTCVLNGTRPVSEKEKAPVKGAIEDLDYVPDIAARAMQGKGSKQIAIVVDNLKNPFFAELVDAIEAAGIEKGFFFSICGRVDMRKYTAHIIARKIDAVYFCSEIKEGEVDYVRQLLDNNIKVLTSPRFPYFQEEISRIDMATGQAIAEAVDYLYGRGHRNIAFLTSFPRESNQDDRLRCFEKRMLERGLSPRSVCPQEVLVSTVDCGKLLFDRLLAAGEPPTAVVGINDLVTIGAMRRAQERGMSVPGQISFVGIDGIELDTLVTPTLTTFRSNAAELGRKAFQMLLDLIENGRTDTYNHKLSLQEGESVRTLE